MVEPEWNDFSVELSLWRDSGQVVDFWWRDDDASRPNPALDRLYDLAARTDIPLGLAVVPESAEAAAFNQLPQNVTVLQLGADHHSRAAQAEKKTEFSADEPIPLALERLIAGRKKLEDLVRDQLLPVLVPPWNRISTGLVPHLSRAGYLGLSTFGVINVTNVPVGLVQINTHVDIIDWKGTRRFCGARSALGQATAHLAARRAEGFRANHPIGWLTHHALHDPAAWVFLESLFKVTRGQEHICWRAPISLFQGGDQ
jgi:hypothetical protein